MKISFFRFALFLIFLGFSLAQLPGFKSTITQNGLNYAKNIGVELLEKLLNTITIPDQHGGKRFFFFSRIYNIFFFFVFSLDNAGFGWSLTNLKLASVSLPNSVVSTVPGQGLHLQISNVGATLNFDWSYREDMWPHISDSGNGDVAISQSNADVQIHIFDSGRRPACNVISSSVSLNNFDVHVNGGPSWLYNFLIGLFKGDIKNAVTGALQNAIQNGVNDALNKLFQGLPIDVKITPYVEIDYGLVADLDFSNNYFSLPELGEFYMINNHVECPAPRSSIPDIINSQMVQMLITEFVAESAGFAFWKLGQLQFNLTQKDIPSWSPVQLNTSYFEYILPNLYNKYPNAAMMLDLSVGAMPTANFETSGATVNAYGFIQVFVLENGSYLSAFTLNGTVSCAGTAKLNEQVIAANLTFINVDFDLYNTNIGPFNVTILDKLINALFQYGIVPAINTILEKGFPLPTVPNLKFVNPAINWGKDYLAVTTDVTYTVPEDEDDLIPILQIKQLALKSSSRSSFSLKHFKL